MRQLTIIFALLIVLPATSSLAQTIPGADENGVSYKVPLEYEIGGITLKGVSSFKENALLARTGLNVGQKIYIPGDETANAVKRLWKLNLFSDVQINLVKVIKNVAFLEIVLKERPRLSQLVIKGISKSDADDLREKFNLRAGDPLTEYDRSNIENIIDKKYIAKGYLNIKTDVFSKPDTAKANSVNLYIDVNRGEKVKISEVVFHGVENVQERKLHKQMKGTKQKPFIDLNPNTYFHRDSSHTFRPFYTLANLSNESIAEYFSDKVRLNIFSSSKFIEDKYEDDKQKVIDYYNNEGYRDAIIEFDTVYLVDDKNLQIEINVSEGPKYYFRNISWEGNTRYPSEILSQIMGIKKGDTYSKKRLNDKLFMDLNGGDISSLYMNEGYLFFNVTPEEVRIENDSIDILVKVYEGPQATINNITIKGNDRTNEHVIRRELRTVPGAKFSRSDLIRSQREISSLGFFDAEQIGIVPKPHPENGTVDIEYTVVEKSSDQLELSAGWGGSVGGLYGTAGIVFNNFAISKILQKKSWAPVPMGDGQQLSLRMQSRGKYLQSYTFSFNEPWLGGKKPNSFTTSLNYTLWNQSGLKRSDSSSSYIITRGITIGYGKRLSWPDDYFTLSSSINIENYFLKDYSGFIIQNGTANNFYLKETLARNSATGNPLFPTGGSNISLSLQLTAPYSYLFPDIVNLPDDQKYKWVEYNKWNLKAEWYKRLAGSTAQGKKQLVLKAVAKFGFLGRYNPDLPLSTFERFQLGGDGLSGGFQLYGYDIISLRGTENAFAPVGGSSNDLNAPIYNKFTLELRYPFSLNPSSIIYGLAFLEGGNSYAGMKYYDPFKLRRSVGVGLRVYLPMFGLLGFDYGIGFDEPGTKDLPFGQKLSKGAFQFKLGFEPE